MNEANRLLDAEAALKVMFDDGKIDTDTYFKGIISLAHDHSFNGDMYKAIDLLSKVTEGYYRSVLGKHMTDDFMFCEVAYGLATKLVVDGYVAFEDFQFSFSRSPAEA